MITLDTSALLALANAEDPNHSRAIEELPLNSAPFLVPAGILAEITYMLDRRARAGSVDAFLADLDSGSLVLHCGDDDLGRIRELIGRYADLPLGFADASVVACAERHRGNVLTFDRDFAVVAREGTIEVRPDA